MNPEKWQKIKTIVQAALEIEPEKRALFVAENCADDKLLRSEVQSLLDSYENAGDFIQKPAFFGKLQVLSTNGFSSKFNTGKRVGRYEVRSLIGKGGMGEVYLAEDLRLRRKIALKILPLDLVGNRERLRRFEQEAEAASALNHPNIITIYEIGEIEDTHFIATEYIEGETLYRHIKGNSMTLKSALDFAIQIVSALQAAHSAGIIHRDIKPENIMVRPDGLLKILDFGIAKLAEQPASNSRSEASRAIQINTHPELVIGTASYMSPEQARGKDVDARSDIFSFGIVFYEMLTGKKPFEGENAMDIIASILNKEPVPLSELFPEVPNGIEKIVNKILKKDREKRYQSAKDLLVDLKQVKQDLDFQKKIARSISINPDEGQTQAFKAATNDEAQTTAGSAEYIARKTSKTFDESSGFNKSWRQNTFTSHAIKIPALILAILVGGFFYLRTLNKPSSTTPPQVKSLAVLPLRSLDTDENYLGLGIADAIIMRISQTGKMTVRPISAVRPYLKSEADSLTAAKQLNVDAVLDGSIQQTGDRLRVSVNLLRANDGVSLWADSFDLSRGDIFTLQDTVSLKVASRLELQLNQSQQANLTKHETTNALAYEYYVKGITSLDQRLFGIQAKPQIETTISLFKRAIEADPNYALAHAQLAFCYAWMAVFVEPDQIWVDQAKAELSLAEALDSQLAETRIVRHMLLYSVYEGFQIEAAIRELYSAQQINPNLGHLELAHLYQHIGLEDLADKHFQRALEIDPTSEHLKRNIMGDYRFVNKYDEWLVVNQKFFSGEPTVWYYLGKGRLDEAENLLKQELAKIPDNRDSRLEKAILLSLKGDFPTAEAEALSALGKEPVKNLQYHHATYDVACVYALGGKSEEAVKWLRETVATGFPSYPLFARDPYLDRIRQSPEFVQFMQVMKSQFEKYKDDFGKQF